MTEIQGHRFLKCRKNGEIQLINDSDAIVEWLDALYLGLRIHALVTYLLILRSWLGAYKTAIYPKRLKIERKLRLMGMAYIKS